MRKGVIFGYFAVLFALASVNGVFRIAEQSARTGFDFYKESLTALFHNQIRFAERCDVILLFERETLRT